MTNPHILKLMNFLRDFADANADSFAPEQIDYLNQAAVAIVVLDEAVDKLVKERDDAYEQLDRYKNGYEGGCHACEVVAVRNQELLAELNSARCTEEDDDGIGYDPHAEAWAARAEEGKKRQEEYRKRHEERIAWTARVREEEAKKRQEGYPPF
jgi:hypothetical protein